MAVVVVVVSVVVAIATAPLEAGLGLPRVVVHQEAAAVDVDLRWHEQYRPQTDELGLLCRLFSCDQPDLFSRDDGPISATEYGTTNPSLLMYTPAGSAAPHLVRAARIHAVREVRGEGTYEPEPGVELVVTEVTTEWTSNIALVEEEAMPVADWQAWDPQKWGIIYDGTQKLHKVDSLVSSLLDERPWAPLCEPVPKYVEVNRTLFRKLVSGPEDPKLVASPAASVHGPYGVAFSSYPPSWTRPGCAQTDAAVQQMFMAASGTSLQDQTPTPGVRLQCGETELDEKNWIAFNYKDQQHFVYSVQPHVVVAARVLDGACSQRWQSNFKPFNDAFAAGLKLHGSATAVPFKGAYLALMHTVDAQNTYTTFAYTFEAEPPFAPTAVSRPLPLQLSASAFASGLLYLPDADKIVVSYGVSNEESRALVMSVDYLEELFVRDRYSS